MRLLEPCILTIGDPYLFPAGATALHRIEAHKENALVYKTVKRVGECSAIIATAAIRHDGKLKIVRIILKVEMRPWPLNRTKYSIQQSSYKKTKATNAISLVAFIRFSII